MGQLIVFGLDKTMFKDAARIVPDSVRLAHRLRKDRAFSRGVRIRLGLLIAYLAIPIDIIPDFIPVIGYADDVIIVGLVLRSVIKSAGMDKVRENWPGTESGLQLLLRLCRLGVS